MRDLPLTQVVKNEYQGNPARWSQDRKLKSLDHMFRRDVRTVLDSLRQVGFKPKLVYGWRSLTRQQRLVDAGYSKVKFGFHNTVDIYSNWPAALAVDIIDKRWGWEKKAATEGFWEALGWAAKFQGLYWGGDWISFKDYAHIQALPNSKLPSIRKAHFREASK